MLGHRQFDLERAAVHVALKGNFVWAPDVNGTYTQDGVLDGDNVGGRVGLNEVRGGAILGGRNPSGNLTQGGLFESWFFLAPRDDVNFAAVGRVGLATFLGGAAPAGDAPPVFVSTATEEELERVPGISRAVARRIVAERAREPFSGLEDFRRRARVNDAQLDQLRDHLIIF
jgi:hypothetical protein